MIINIKRCDDVFRRVVRRSILLCTKKLKKKKKSQKNTNFARRFVNCF